MLKSNPKKFESLLKLTQSNSPVNNSNNILSNPKISPNNKIFSNPFSQRNYSRINLFLNVIIPELIFSKRVYFLII